MAKCLNDVLEFIKEKEGCILESYKDVTGVWTIGYGHTRNACKGQKITKGMAERLFLEDIGEVEKQLDNLLDELDRKYTDYQYSALVSFTFNLGIKNTRKLLQYRTNEHEIATAMMLYCYAGKMKLDGLYKRRKREAEYFLMYTLEEVRKVRYLIKPNYHIRKEPSTSGEIIITYDFSVYVEVIGICGEWVSTNRGFIHKEAFYCIFN